MSVCDVVILNIGIGLKLNRVKTRITSFNANSTLHIHMHEGLMLQWNKTYQPLLEPN